MDAKWKCCRYNEVRGVRPTSNAAFREVYVKIASETWYSSAPFRRAIITVHSVRNFYFTHFCHRTNVYSPQAEIASYNKDKAIGKVSLSGARSLKRILLNRKATRRKQIPKLRNVAEKFIWARILIWLTLLPTLSEDLMCGTFLQSVELCIFVLKKNRKRD